MKTERSFSWLLLAAALAVPPYAIGQASRDAAKGDATSKQDTKSASKEDTKSASKQEAKSVSKQDAKFMDEIAQANLAEVAIGKLGEEKAASDGVRKFAKHMVDDHSKMLDEGGKLAKSKGVEPPSAPDKKQQAAQKKLEGLSGEKFDRAFMDQMVKDHEQALKLVNQTAQKANDPELKAMAHKAAPEVEEHLKMARELSSKSGEARGAAASNAKGK